MTGPQKAVTAVTPESKTVSHCHSEPSGEESRFVVILL